MINWVWDNQLSFFGLLFVQYVLVFEFQSWIKKHMLAKPVYVIFIIQDWLLNIVISLWFLDLPHETGELVTGRMKRYKSHGGYSYRGISNDALESVRYRFAIIVCKALNVWDKGHC